MYENEGIATGGNVVSVPDTVRWYIVSQKIQAWRNTVYDAELDARVAEALENKAGKAQAEKRMKDALKAIDLLEGLLDDIPTGGVADGTGTDSD